MLCLRPLNRNSICTGLLIVSSIGWASPATLQSSTSVVSLKGSPSTAQQNDQSQTSSFSQSLLYQSQELKGGWSFQIGNTLAQTPDSQLAIRDFKGNQLTLGNENKWTQELKLALVAHQKSTTYKINLDKSVDNTAFNSQMASFEISSQIPEQLADVGLKLSTSEKLRPQTYYFDNYFSTSTLKWLARPNQINQQNLSGYFEQIWADNYKTRLELTLGMRNEERPGHLNLELRNYVIVDNRNSVRIDGGFSSENRSDALQNERGYYNMGWAEAQFQHLITYNLLLGFSYGYLVEREDEVRTGRVTQVGSDLLGLSALYSGRGWQVNVKYEAIQSNTSFGSDQVQGILTWEI